MFLVISILNFQVKRPKTPVNQLGWTQVGAENMIPAPPIVAMLIRKNNG